MRPIIISPINTRQGESQQSDRRNVNHLLRYHCHAGSFQQKPVWQSQETVKRKVLQMLFSLFNIHV